VEELIGPDTVDTIPPATFNAFRDHGQPRASLIEEVPVAHAVMDSLAKAGISIKAVTDKLLEEGLQQFQTAFDALLEATGKASVKINRQSVKLAVQGVDELADDRQALVHGQRAGERRAFDQLHDEGALFDTVNLGDIRVIERGEHLRLAVEAGHAVGIGGEGFGQDLEGDVAIQLGVGGAPDFTHATCTQLGRDAVMRNAGMRAHCSISSIVPLFARTTRYSDRCPIAFR
jgi:hypothetical protein